MKIIEAQVFSTLAELRDWINTIPNPETIGFDNINGLIVRTIALAYGSTVHDVTFELRS